jgi:peptidoglycan/LPS O-acetylase OafA/YrhL
METSQQRIFGLDLMRAIAILMVLVGHCAWIFSDESETAISLLALSSFMGVEIFFVLSGFLIGRILYRQFTSGQFGVKQVLGFLRRRWFRTFPNYFLILFVNIAIGLFLGLQLDTSWQYFLFLQNFASPMKPFFTESWSLSVEEFAYLILPFSLLLAIIVFTVTNKSRLFLLLTIALIFVFITMKVVYNSMTPNSAIDEWNLAVKSVVIYRLDSIFIGVLASWIYSNHIDLWRQSKTFFAVVGVLMMMFFTFGVGWFRLLIADYPFFWNVVYLPLVSLSIGFFLPVLSEWKSAPRFVSAPVTFVSLISYSIYLLHYSIVLQLLKHFINTENLSKPELLFFTISYFFTTLFLSFLLYRFYERPMMNKRDKTTAMP